jgi:NAD(P)-dependent dehydrogenase (short-subunit alcohol dehydrogenase family)
VGKIVVIIASARGYGTVLAEALAKPFRGDRAARRRADRRNRLASRGREKPFRWAQMLRNGLDPIRLELQTPGIGRPF